MIKRATMLQLAVDRVSCFIRASAAWGFVFVLAVLVISFALSTRPVVEFSNNGYLIPDHVKAGGTVMLCRDMRFLREVDITISRSLVCASCAGEPDKRDDFGAINVHREPGPVRQCRPVRIPDDEPHGHYVLHTRLRWVDWPFWRKTLEIPAVALEIVP